MTKHEGVYQDALRLVRRIDNDFGYDIIHTKDWISTTPPRNLFFTEKWLGTNMQTDP